MDTALSKYGTRLTVVVLTFSVLAQGAVPPCTLHPIVIALPLQLPIGGRGAVTLDI